jgi:hypothetical protein
MRQCRDAASKACEWKRAHQLSLRRLRKPETRAVYVEMAVRVRQGRSVLQCPLVPWFAFPQTHDALRCPPSNQLPHNRKASDSSIVCT